MTTSMFAVLSIIALILNIVTETHTLVTLYRQVTRARRPSNASRTPLGHEHRSDGCA